MYKTLRAPLTVQIELCSACTANCVHCYNFWRANQDDCIKNSFLSESQIKQILQKLADANIFDIIITGGEPLLNKAGVITCLKEAARLGMNTSLNSNLMPLSLKYAQELRHLGLKYILTSVLGPNAKVHDSVTQRAGSFEKTVNNIKLAMQAGLGIVTNMVVTRLNLEYVKDTARFVKSIGVSKFVATKAGCPGSCTDFSQFAISLEEFREYLHDLHTVGKELDIQIDVLESYPLCGIKNIDAYKKISSRKCLAGVTTFTVASDGNVRPCSHLDASYGNILEEDICDIWRRMAEWRNGSFLPQTCKQCPLLSLCGGGCRMEAKTKHGNLSAMDPYSSPADVEFCMQLLKSNKGKQKKKVNRKISLFTLNEVRWREEAFGSVIVVNKKTRVYLNHAGTNVFKQLKKNKTYTLQSREIDWSNLNPEKFILGLADRKIVSLI